MTATAESGLKVEVAERWLPTGGCGSIPMGRFLRGFVSCTHAISQDALTSSICGLERALTTIEIERVRADQPPERETAKPSSLPIK
jgi:hypothetical protein